MNRPNFFILGFPKCGTTALAGYLAERQDVLFSKHKEPHYFASDFTCPVIRRVTTERDYLEQFASDRQDFMAVGEASTGYIFSEVAVDRIMRFADDPRFILIVRNPVDMAVSAHAQMLRSGHEDVEDFSEAWRLSPFREKGESLPRHRTEPWHVIYQRFGCVGSRLRWLIDRVGRDRLMVIVFDDFANDPKRVYLDVLKFLNLPADGRSNFAPRNERVYHRTKILANFVNRPPRVLVSVSQAIKKAAGLKRLGVIDRLRRWNLRPEDRPLDLALVREMQEHYRAEIELLEQEIGRRLPWLPERSGEQGDVATNRSNS